MFNRITLEHNKLDFLALLKSKIGKFLSIIGWPIKHVTYHHYVNTS